MYHGDIRLGDTIDIKFTTVQTTGAGFTLAGSPVISAYPANSTTQLTAGITLSVDFDSVTGLNNVRVVASSGNGYLTATNYALVITTGTVNSVSVVGYVIGTFSIEARSALMPTTGGRTAVVDASGLIDANTVKIGPTGAGTAQTARDIGTNVLISSGTGTGQLSVTSGVVDANTTKVSGTAQTAGDLKASINAILTTAMTESYSTDGSTKTVAQALYELCAFLFESNISSTTLTAKKIDGSASAMTFTLSDATNPVTITRAT